MLCALHEVVSRRDRLEESGDVSSQRNRINDHSTDKMIREY
jgi:hypothetical protein